MKPNAKIVAACRQALDWWQEYSDRRDLCDQWMVTFARSIGSNKRPATIMRVNRWFESHDQLRSTEGFFSTSDPSAERIAWDMLGGDDGRQWAATYVANHAEEDLGEASTADQLIELDDQASAMEAAAGRVQSFQNRPLNADQWASPAAFAEFEGRRPEWAGVLALEGVETSDRRFIKPGALTWRNLPITLQDQLLSQAGHDGAVAAGPITNIFREGNEIRGEGFFDSGDEGQAARRRMQEGTKQGVSIDLAELELELPDDPEELMAILMGDALLVISAGRIGAATLVSIPAFEAARLQIVGSVSTLEPDALVASGGVVPPDLTMRVVMPIEAFTAGYDTADGDDIEQIQWFGVDELAPGQTPGEGEGIDGHLYTITETAPALTGSDPELAWWTKPIGPGTYHGWRRDTPDGGGGFEPEPLADGDPAVATIGQLRDDLEQGFTADDFADVGVEHGISPESQALTASAGGARPPAAWFEQRDYSDAIPFIVTDPDQNGLRQIHGHIALWGSCHIGFSDRCVDVPRGLDYDSFQGPKVPGVVHCSDGSVLRAGPIVMDSVHPSLKAKASDASAHYAHTGSLVAQGRLFEDAFGLQLRGWILSGVSDAQVDRLRAADLSPDWRGRATARGGQGVVCVLAVPVSGFNIGLVASAGDVPADEMTVVGTNWAPRHAEAAARKVEVMTRLGLTVPDRVLVAAAAVEPPELTHRKAAVLARLASEGPPNCECGCGLAS